MGKRRRYKKKEYLFPEEWYSYAKAEYFNLPPSYGMHSRPSVEEINKYLATKVGNIYAYTPWPSVGGVCLIQGSPGKLLKPVYRKTCILLGFLVGNGNYMSLTWWNLKTSTKEEENIKFTAHQNTWELVSEMKLEGY